MPMMGDGSLAWTDPLSNETYRQMEAIRLGLAGLAFRLSLLGPNVSIAEGEPSVSEGVPLNGLVIYNVEATFLRTNAFSHDKDRPEILFRFQYSDGPVLDGQSFMRVAMPTSILTTTNVGVLDMIRKALLSLQVAVVNKQREYEKTIPMVKILRGL